MERERTERRLLARDYSEAIKPEKTEKLMEEEMAIAKSEKRKRELGDQKHCLTVTANDFFSP